MLSPQTLERVSVAYRRGYYDGYHGKTGYFGTNVKPVYTFPFSEGDYKQGIEAGETDKSHDDLNAKAHKARMKEHKKMLNKYLENLRALDALDGSQLNDALAYLTASGATSKHRIKLNAIALFHGYMYDATNQRYEKFEDFVLGNIIN